MKLVQVWIVIIILISPLNIFYILILILFMTIILYSCVMLSILNINDIWAGERWSQHASLNHAGTRPCLSSLHVYKPTHLSGVPPRNTQLWLAEMGGFPGFFLYTWFISNGGVAFKNIYIVPQFNWCLIIIWLWLFYGFLPYRIAYRNANSTQMTFSTDAMLCNQALRPQRRQTKHINQI